MCARKCAFWIVCVCAFLYCRKNQIPPPLRPQPVSWEKRPATTETAVRNNGKTLRCIELLWCGNVVEQYTYIEECWVIRMLCLHVCFQNDSTCWKVCDCIYCFLISFGPHFPNVLHACTVRDTLVCAVLLHMLCIECGWFELCTIQCTRGFQNFRQSFQKCKIVGFFGRLKSLAKSNAILDEQCLIWNHHSVSF